MDFRQLEVFVTVVREGNFSKAAEKLYLTQPTVSSHVESLEKDCGVTLFERRNRKAILTEAGRNFYPYVVDMLGLKEQARESFHQFHNKIDGKITIKASQTPGIYLLPQLLSTFKNDYPETSFNVSIYDTEEVFASILNYEADLGLVGSILQNEKVLAKPMVKDELVLIASSPWEEFLKEKEKINTDGSIELSEILEIPFIFRTKGSATRRAFERALSEWDKNISELNIVGEMDSLEGVKNCVRHGMGVAFVSDYSVREDEGLTKFMIDKFYPKRSFYVVYHKDRILSPTSERFLEHVQSVELP